MSVELKEACSLLKYSTYFKYHCGNTKMLQWFSDGDRYQITTYWINIFGSAWIGIRHWILTNSSLASVMRINLDWPRMRGMLYHLTLFHSCVSLLCFTPVFHSSVLVKCAVSGMGFTVWWCCTYFRADIHLRFKHAVLGTYLSYQGCELVVFITNWMLVVRY